LQLKGIEIDRYLEFTAGLWFNQMQSVNDHLLNLVQNEKGAFYLANQYYNLSAAAGIEYLVDVSKPVGNRVRILGLSTGKPFYNDSVYRVAMNSYRGSGGGGHLAAAGLSDKEIKERLVWSSTHDIRLLVLRYIEQKKVVEPSTFNNWRIIPEDFYLAGSKRDSRLIFKDIN
jgi:2',3'-cyclic-nucleotide 2'-phosphodiesterase/3'-nucleotidase